MGLPLFVAPVESDLPSKAAAKNAIDPAATRSPIRRTDRRRQLHETREHRLRLLAALQGNDEDILSGLRSSASSPRLVAREGSSTDAETERMLRELLRHENQRAARELERERALRDARNERMNELAQARNAIRRRASRNLDQYRESYVRGNGSGSIWADALRHRDSDERWIRRLERVRGEIVSSAAMASQGEPIQPPSRSPSRLLRGIRRHRVRYVDGLGDRDRSLSPDGDGVWDTLQSTLTPDPQPPSVGSSFASTNASAAASQNPSALASSSNTAITSPDLETELPCEPGTANSDSEGENDGVEGNQRARAELQDEIDERRTYADVAAQAQDEGERFLLRLVGDLAAQEVFPEDWWPEAGLGPSTSFEDSN